MLGEEDMDNTEAGEEGTYYSRSVWQRMTVILAGPFFNFILAFILALFVTGIVGYDPALVTGVTKDTPAYDAGLRAGDTIKKMNHSNISIGREIDSFFLYNGVSTKPIEVIYERDGEKYETTLYPEKIKKYLLGFTYNLTDSSVAVEELEKGYPMEEAGVEKGDIILEINGHKILSGKELNQFFSAYPLDGSEVQMLLERNGSEFTVSITPRFISETYSVGFKYWIVSTVRNIGMLVTGRLSKDDVGGAVAIVDMIGDSYEETKATGSTLDVVLQLMYITILLSANLGVMNLLPIPALDGGKFLFLIAEAVAGKPLNRKVEGIVNLAGFVLLMLLMVFVFFNDIMRLIGR